MLMCLMLQNFQAFILALIVASLYSMNGVSKDSDF